MLIGYTLSPGQTALLALIALAVGLMLWSTRRRVARSQRHASRPTLADQGIGDVRQQMERLLVELHDISREMNARLDTKIRVLSNLINEADERIRRLEALVSQVGMREATGTASRSGRAEPPPAHGAASGPAARNPAPQPPPERYAEIYALADKGLDAQQIAQQTSTPTGEVELILGLRSKGAR